MINAVSLSVNFTTWIPSGYTVIRLLTIKR
jgi:hypothetical protein